MSDRVEDRRLAALLRTFVPDGRLVDEGLLGREHGMYWRTGGWVDVLGA
ncbi:MAG TPA: hypothetical protein VGR06_01405 [Actinophytocola sp.]|jgi:hypothetical protein|nr:hypothetical protein [Actinophytocola sp.]